MIKMKGLGRGLDALLSGSDRPQGDEQRNLPVERLRPGKYQPRTHMEEGALMELAASIKAQGVMQPILVRAVDKTPGAERYEIVAGERRWRAAQLAGLSEVPVLIRQIPDEQALAMALIENIQRENLNPLEEATGIQRLINEFDMTHQLAAEAVGRSRSAVSNLLRLLNLAHPVQELLMHNQLDMGHARALLSLPNVGQITVANEIVGKGLSVREAERLVQRQQRPVDSKPKAKPDRDIIRLQEELAEKLGAMVTLKTQNKGRGKLIINYDSLEQLDNIIGRLGEK